MTAEASTGPVSTISHEDRGPIQSVMFEIQKDCSQPLAVELEPLRNFYPAEDYHQNYLQNHPHGYCHIDFSSLKDLIVRPDGRTGIKQDRAELQKQLTREQYDVTRMLHRKALYRTILESSRTRSICGYRYRRASFYLCPQI